MTCDRIPFIFHYEHLSEPLFHTINGKKKLWFATEKTFAILFMEFSGYGNELRAIPSKQTLQVLIKPLRIIHTFQKPLLLLRAALILRTVVDVSLHLGEETANKAACKGLSLKSPCHAAPNLCDYRCFCRECPCLPIPLFHKWIWPLVNELPNTQNCVYVTSNSNSPALVVCVSWRT